MHPVLFSLGHINVYSYGLMVALGFIAASLLSSKLAEKEGVDPDKIIDICLLILVAGIIGARLFYVITNFDYYRNDVIGILRLTDGGLAFYGGFFFALFFSVFYAFRKKLSVWRIGDIIAPYAALGHSIGRIGCFLNGCCYGGPTDLPWGVIFPGSRTIVHPTQIYASLDSLAIFIILRYVYPKRSFSGQVFLGYFLLYGASRFFEELIRRDSPRILYGLTIWQVISLCVFAAALMIYIYRGIAWKSIRSRQK